MRRVSKLSTIPPGRSGEIRFLNTTEQNLRIELNDSVLARNVGFGQATRYFRVSPSCHIIKIFPEKSLSPILTQKIRIPPGVSVTAGIIPRGCGFVLNIVADTPCPLDSRCAYVRFVNYSPSTILDIFQGACKRLFSNLPYTGVTPYFKCDPGILDFICVPRCRPKDKLVLRSIPLERRFPKTIYIFGKPGITLSSRILLDN